jgi:hypothetical protein
MHGQSKNDSPLLEFIGLCVAWAKAEPAIFGSSSLFARLKSSAFRLSAIAMFAVTRGSSLLFGIGSSALPLWGQEDEVAQSGARSDRVQRPAQEPYANSPHPSSREGHLSADWRSSDILLFWHSAFWRAVFQRSN